jgi:tetratricopeptide (TPR) repeat protein
MAAKTVKAKETSTAVDSTTAGTVADTPAPVPNPIDDLLKQSRDAYHARDWTLLRRLVAEGLAKAPANYELMLLRARASTNLRDWEDAAASWGAVCNVRPTWAEAWFQHARSLNRMNDRPGAARVAQELFALSESDPGALIFHIRIAFEIEDIRGASAALAKLVKVDREAAEREAANFDRDGDLRALLIATKTLHDAGPGAGHDDEKLQDMTEQLLRRAISRERADQLADAYLDCAVLLDIYPDDSLAQKSMARVLRSLQQKADRALKEERFEEACDAYREVLRCTPGDPDRLVSYGRALLRLRRNAEAIPIWQHVVSDFPDRREGHIQLARALDRASKFGAATTAWRDVLARDPENAEAQQALSAISRRAITAGRAAIVEENFVEAWRIFSDLRAELPDDEEPPRRLDQIERNILKTMRAAYKSRELQGIFNYYQQIPGLLNEVAEGQLLFARALTELHRYDLAAKAWHRLADLDPLSSAKPHLQIARCYLRAGLPMEAGAAISELRAREPDNPEARKMQTDLREMLLTANLTR